MISPSISRLVSSVPLYIQIAENLMAKIENGEYKPGDKLPTERELCEQLDVHRATVRQALSVLKDRGLIERKQGSGTFVAEKKIERGAVQLFAFTKILSTQGYKVGAKIVSHRELPANEAVAQKLQISVGTPIYYFHRLRFVNDKPVMLEKMRMPAHIFPNIVDKDLEKHSIYEVMEVEYGRKVTEATQFLESVAASNFEAECLGISPGAPIMMEERVARDQNGEIIEYSRDLYRGDRFRFMVESARFDIELKTGGGKP